MAFFQVDDQLAFHSKAVAAGNAAMGLWVRAGSWSMAQLTEGHVPMEMVRALGTTGQAKRLVEAGLWAPSERGGFQFHQFGERQLSAEEVKERRRLRAEAGRKGGRASGESRRKPKPEANGEAFASTKPEANASEKLKQKRTPVPVPTQEVPNGTSIRPPVNETPHLPARRPGDRREANLAALNDTAHSPQAHQIARAYTNWLDGPVDGRTLTEVAVEIDQLLDSEISPHQIAAGIKAWHESDSWSPSQIRRFVHKARPGPAASPGVGKPTQKAMNHLSVAEQIIAEMETA